MSGVPDPGVAARPSAGDVDALLKEQLESLLALRNTFAQCTSIEELSRRALEVAQEKVPAQVFALFLLDKEGMVSRVAIRGTNLEGAEISDTWFSPERYTVGESFTGGAAKAADGAPFGEPKWSNDLDRNVVLKNRDSYLHLLGHLSSGVAIPLNGRYRTFGVLRVLNRRPAGEISGTLGFSQADVFWLAHIGGSLANAITGIRRAESFGVLAKISGKLAEPFQTPPDIPGAYAAIARSLVGPASPNCAVIIRIKNPSNELEVVGRAGDGISWDGWKGEPIAQGKGLVAKVAETGEPIIVSDIRQELSRFGNAPWLLKNRLEAFACFPLMASSKAVGTLVVLRPFAQSFTPADRMFLETVSTLIASFSESNRVSESLHAVVQLAQDESSREASMTTRVMLRNEQRRLRDAVHLHKNDMYEIMRDLEEAEASGQNRRTLLLRKALEYARASHERAYAQLGSLDDADGGGAVDVNALVMGLVQLFTVGTKRRSIVIEPRLADDVPWLVIDESDLKHAVRNVLENAVKAVEHSRREDGHVVVSTGLVMDRGQECVQITVQDNGVGIRKEDAPLVFNADFTRFERGTGSGLYTTREIMRQYDGEVSFTSEYGRGSVFSLLIPTAPYRAD